jgi:hypothetical protein
MRMSLPQFVLLHVILLEVQETGKSGLFYGI